MSRANRRKEEEGVLFVPLSVVGLAELGFELLLETGDARHVVVSVLGEIERR